MNAPEPAEPMRAFVWAFVAVSAVAIGSPVATAVRKDRVLQRQADALERIAGLLEGREVQKCSYWKDPDGNLRSLCPGWTEHQPPTIKVPPSREDEDFNRRLDDAVRRAHEAQKDCAKAAREESCPL